MLESRKFILDVIKGLANEVPHLLTRDLKGASERQLCAGRITKLFDYTMGNGKCLRSCLAFDAYNALNPGTSRDNLLRVGKVAATLELLQTFFLILDDMVDDATTRRNQKCWHLLKGVGLTAINDGLLLDNSIDLVVRHTIPTHPKLEIIIRTIYEAKRRTIVGQILDCDSKIKDFNWDRYNAIVENKTSYYTYYLPLKLAFYLGDRSDNLSALQSIACKIGYLFQAQDDFLDCFGNSEITGKSNNDLSQGKCTWVTCRFIEKVQGNNSKLNEFYKCFGEKDKQSVDTTRKLIFSEAIDEDFRKFQDQLVMDLRSDIQSFPIQPLHRVLNLAVDNIVDRKK